MSFLKMFGSGLEPIKKLFGMFATVLELTNKLVGVISARSKKKKRKKKYEAKRAFDDYSDKYK